MPFESDQTSQSPLPLATNSEASMSFSQRGVLQDLTQLRSGLQHDLCKFDQVDVEETLQSEYAKLAVLIQRLERVALRTRSRQVQKLGELSNLVCSLRVAMTSLGQQKPNLSLARQIRLDVEQELVQNEHVFPPSRFLINRFLYVWHSPSTPLKVIYGLICAFVLIFGSLFSLAVLQYAIYAAGTAKADLKEYKAAKTREVALSREMFWQEQLQKQKLTIEERKFSQPLAEDPVAAARLADLREQLKRTSKKIQDLQVLQADQKPQRPPDELSAVQQVLANFADIGISRTLSQMLWVAAAGTLGSIVSILIRVVEEFHDKDYRDRLTPFFIGFFKPVIGASFGILFLAFVNSGVVSTPLFMEAKPQTVAPAQPMTDSIPENRAAFFLFAIAFVVGFSERLAKDTITRLDGTVDKPNAPAFPSPPPPRIIVIRPKRYIALYPRARPGNGEVPPPSPPQDADPQPDQN